MSEYSDDELINLFKTGDNPNYAFNLIVKKYQERLYWHIRRLVLIHEDADDVLQNTLLKAWLGLEKFQSNAQLYTWLYRIATNESLNHLNKQKRKSLFSFQTLEKQLSNQLKADSYFEGDEIQYKLQQALLKLPEKQRIVFNLKYFEEMKYEEMADILNTSVGALKASYHIATKKIEEFIKSN
jgi:RNA polymerase sigma-70 factor (ECF subfamily)